MKKIAASAMLACTTGLFLLQDVARAQTPLPTPQQAWQQAVPGTVLAGQARMKFWGFEVYQASLWVPTGFDAQAFERSALALELVYLRDFKGADIARRSVQEMRRQADLDAGQTERWQTQMQAVFPDVKAGDALTGVHQPGVGAAFWHNGRWVGEVRDAAFAKLFFGIWLSTKTSEPTLRQALLAQVKPRAAGAATP